MKSSTLHRSNLSKERIAVLEELISDKRRPMTTSPGVYMRNNKDKDLDLLWQDLKSNSQKSVTRSSASLIAMGFIGGAICTFLLSSIFYSNSANDIDYTAWKKSSNAPVALNVAPADEVNTATATVPLKEYTVQSGDTLDSISLKFYGTIAGASKIQKKNNLQNPHRISIGQKLLIPVE